MIGWITLWKDKEINSANELKPGLADIGGFTSQLYMIDHTYYYKALKGVE